MKIYFNIDKLEVGRYKVGTFSIDMISQMPGRVALEVPDIFIDNLEYVKNNPEIEPEPVLNLAGLRYCYLKLHDALTLDPVDLSTAYCPVDAQDNDEPDNDDNENWDFGKE